jgi:CubicO group peptidase (beta-lactamase class C family)
MASGLDADEDDPATPGYEDRLAESADWIRFALDLPVAREPGRSWAYASVNAFLLGAVVEEASGRPLAEFARERLFEPLGIKKFRWQSTPSGRTVGQGNLSLRARDMAKIGQLYLDRGRWAGVEVVPGAWVDASVAPRYKVPWEGYDSYGYGWFMHGLTTAGRERRYFFASGNGGNKIYVLPDEHMVVVIQSAAYNTSYGQRRSQDVLARVLATLAE